jgi:hypothetical protein
MMATAPIGAVATKKSRILFKNPATRSTIGGIHINPLDPQQEYRAFIVPALAGGLALVAAGIAVMSPGCFDRVGLLWSPRMPATPPQRMPFQIIQILTVLFLGIFNYLCVYSCMNEM